MSFAKKEPVAAEESCNRRHPSARPFLATPFSICILVLAGGLALVALLFHLAPWTRSTFSVPSGDGTCVLHGEEKQRLLKTGRVQWIFDDTEAQWEATRLHFQVGQQRLEVPNRLVGLISHPSKTGLSMSRTSSSDLTITLWGEQGSGSETLTLRYKDGKLTRAEVIGIQSDQPWVVYP